LDALSGESLGDFTMKQPKMSNLKKDKKGTKAMREAMTQTKKIKITINFDSDVLNEVKKLADDMGSPYQTLLNKMVKDSLKQKKAEETRLDKLEKELKAIKKKIA